MRKFTSAEWRRVCEDACMETTTSTYLTKLREFATSILEGVQSLEDQRATIDDDKEFGVLSALVKADEATWALATWIAEGRVWE